MLQLKMPHSGLVVALTVALLVPGAAQVLAETESQAVDDSPQASVILDGRGIQIEGDRRAGVGSERVPDVNGGPSPTPVGGGVVDESAVAALEPAWGVQPETGDACIALVPRRDIDPTSDLNVDWELATLGMIADPRVGDPGNPFCDPAAAQAALRPHGAANAFIRSVTLPDPGIRIDPGFALTGMATYLEVEGLGGFVHSDDLAGWGTLNVAFESVAIEVDWGDGTTSLVDDGRSGAAFDGDPAEQITHIYDRRGPDTEVAVTAFWRAEWNIAGFSGVVDGLSVDAVLPLPVREFRAVRVTPDS